MSQQQKTDTPQPFDTSIPDSIKAIIGDAPEAKDAYLDYYLLSQS